MPCFLDTTIVVSAAKRDKDWLQAHEPHLKANPAAEAPTYAIRELTAGFLQVWAAAHNQVVRMRNPGDAIALVASLPDVAGRKKSGQLKVLAEALAAALKLPAAADEPMFTQVRRDMCQSMMIDIQRTWKRARNSKSFQQVQPLGCFMDSDLELDEAGLLSGPERRWECNPRARCSAAEHLADKMTDVVAVLRSIPVEKGAEKRETTRRRQALKDLVDNGPIKFSKKNCRALGDAYFAIMAPPGSHVVTTNLSDHASLCAALGKQAVDPSRPPA